MRIIDQWSYLNNRSYPVGFAGSFQFTTFVNYEVTQNSQLLNIQGLMLDLKYFRDGIVDLYAS
jgi:hypothetical protein